MTDATKLKQKILKTLQIYKIEELDTKDKKDVKFALRLLPFEVKYFVVIIEYRPKFDILRIISNVGTPKSLRESYKEKNEAEKNEINALFAKVIRSRSFNADMPENFSVIEGFRFLLIQNMTSQTLLDAVSEAVFLLQDLGELLYQADQSLKVPQVSETSNNMFQ